MASSVLGKRTRSSTGAAATPPAKRQASTSLYNDENVNPVTVCRTRGKVQHVESLELSELIDVTPIKSSPAKHGAAGAQAVLQSVNTVKVVHPVTPQTPRFRDALSKRVPTTPRHRILVNGALTPRTPRTPTTPGGSSATIYNIARQLFTRSNDPGTLVGRDDERKELAHFVNTCIESNTGGCTYVSGPPGTGKSALVNEVTANITESATVKKAYVNCMSMKTSNDIYATLLDTLHKDIEVLEGDEIMTLQGMFAPRKSSTILYVVTLDELDHVLSLDVEFLYKLFEWSLQKSSKLILLGIANALDLTDRFLPRLKARNLKPQLLPFMPYNATQIKLVITTRLKSLIPANSVVPDFVPFLHPAAIDLCSRKVSSQTGDLRKALDICRGAIDLIESETKQKLQQQIDSQLQSSPSRILGEKVNLSSPSIQSPSRMLQSKTLSQALSEYTVETAPRASIGHLNKVTAAAFGNGSNQRLKALNLQQKAALCALVALEKKKRISAANIMATPSKSNTLAPTVKALYDTYCMLCRRDSQLQPLTSTEFRDVVGSLETLSLINGVDGKSGSFVALNTPTKRGRKTGFGGGVGVGDEKRVGSCVGERELEQAVDGKGGDILRSILSGEGLE